MLHTHTKLRLPAEGARLTGERQSLSVQDMETGALSGLDWGTGALSGLNSGLGALSGQDVEPGVTEGSKQCGRRGGKSASTSIASPSKSSSPRSKFSSPSAMVQGAELLSTLSLSMAFSLVAGIVAGSCTWSDVISGSTAILSTIALCGDCSSVAAGSGLSSASWGDGGLCSGSGCALDRG